MKQFKILKFCLLLSLFTVTALWPGASMSAEEIAVAPKRVLVLFGFNQGRIFPYFLQGSLQAALIKAPHPVRLDIEYLDFVRFPEETYRAKITDLYRYKYGERKVDLVLAIGEVATSFVSETGETLFGDVPMILVAGGDKKLPHSHLKPNMRSMAWGVDFEKTVLLIQSLFPKTKNLYVISGTSLTDKEVKKAAAEVVDKFADRFAIHYLDNLSAEDLFVKTVQLPEDSVMLLLTMLRDGNGKFVPMELTSKISAKTNTPMFGVVDLFLGYGILGGDLLSPTAVGKKIATISKKILAGEPVTNAELMDKSNLTMFDWRQLKRWSIDAERLPANSIIRYRKPTVWEVHKWHIIGIIITISALLLVLLALAIQYRKRGLAEGEARKLRDERAHMSQVLAMGEIAASMAHELNQPLSAIRSYAQSAQRFLDKDAVESAETRAALTGIVAGNRRAEEVIKRIRMALKKEPFKRSSFEVREITEEVVMLIRRNAHVAGIALRLNLAADLPPIFCDRIKLQQVLFNLLSNSIEAVSKVTDGPCEIAVEALREGSDNVRISVRDSGIGIDEEQVDLLFDPFYTTRAEGMGIGLSLSRSIVEEHGGQLWVTRNPDRGVTFSFTIPNYRIRV